MEATVPQVSLRPFPLWAGVLLGSSVAPVQAAGHDQDLFTTALRSEPRRPPHESFHGGRHLLGFLCL
jgi:hypothetical protein